MKVHTLILCTLLLICNSVFAQEAIKENEIVNITCEDFLSRKDNLRMWLNEDPNAISYILVYEGKINYYNSKHDKSYSVYPHFGEAKEYIRTMKKWMTFSRFPLDKVVFVNAGFREKLTVEFWFVPNGATPPKPKPTLTKMKYRKGKPVSFCDGCC